MSKYVLLDVHSFLYWGLVIVCRLARLLQHELIEVGANAKLGHIDSHK